MPLSDETARYIHQAAEKHLDECWEAYYAAEDEPDPDKWPESPAMAPFCGCQTCTVREILHGAWQAIEQADLDLGPRISPRRIRPSPLENDVDEHLNRESPRHDRFPDEDRPGREEL